MAQNPLNEDWDDDDNKRQRGKIDRIYVSLTEEYEVDHFVEAYLKRRGAADNAKNRQLVVDKMRQYTGRAPIKRTDLNDWLDGLLRVTSSK